MAITFLDSVIGTPTTPGIDSATAPADFIITARNAASFGFTDSETNTWTDGTIAQESTTPLYGKLAWNTGALTTNASHTFTAGIFYATIVAATFTGVDYAAGVDAQSVFPQSTAGTSTSAGSVTPSENGCLIVAYLQTSGVVSGVSISDGFTIIENGAQDYVAYKIQATAAAINPTWSWTSSEKSVAAIAVFTPAAGGATDYSTTLDAGTYNITGQDVTMTYSPASGGTDYSVTLEAGTYTITGQGANSLYSVAIEAGSYSITGQDLTLTYTPTSGPAAYSVTLDAGTYNITGRSINLLWSGAPNGGGLSKKLSLSMSIGL